MKEVIKPTYADLEQQVRELQSELDSRPEMTFHPVAHFTNLYSFIDNPTPENMFALGLEYEKMGQTASAIGYYHQCAERAVDNNLLTYEALIRMSLCYEKQGGRKAHEKLALQHAIGIIPNRPEAYYFLSSLYERQGAEDNHERWFDSYGVACMGESHEFNLATKIPDLQPLQTDTGYYGVHGCTFQKAVALWWIGRGDDARKLFAELDKRNDFPSNIRELITNNIKMLKSNEGRQPE